MKFYYLLPILVSSSLIAQVGIGTEDPKSLLHIEASNTNSPSGKDGILIPKVSLLPSKAKAKGQLVFLENNPTLENGFYYWDGEDWNSYLINNFNKEYDKSIYVITGVGYSGSGIEERDVYFDKITSYDVGNFSLNDNKITIGKTGYYLISFNSSLKKDSEELYRATYTYSIKNNSNIILSSSNSIPDEKVTSTGVSLSGIVKLEEGDLINVTIIKSNENNFSNIYEGYGTNALTLTFLK